MVTLLEDRMPTGSRRATHQARRNVAYEHPFEVSSQAIANLGQDEFVSFAASLIAAEVMWYGGTPRDVLANFAPGRDGGRDAVTVRTVAMRANDGFIPLGRTIWQCKAELRTPTVDEFADEMSKPQPMACLEGGGSYIFVAQNPRNNEDDVEAALKSIALSWGFNENQVRLYAQTRLAEYARRHPSLSLLPFFPGRAAGMEPFATWARDHEAISFEPTAHRDHYVELCSALVPGRFHVAVTGATGVGKSRLVLEAIRAKGLEAYVAYARSPGRHVDDLVNHIRVNSRSCILIVDECGRAHASVLREALATTDAGLITIEIEREGAATRPPVGDALVRLEPLSARVVARVLAGHQGLDDAARGWVAEQTGGFIKLARLLADELAREGAAIGSLNTLVAATEVEHALERMVGNDHGQISLLRLFACFSSIEHLPSAANAESLQLAGRLGVTAHQLGEVVARVRQEQLLMEGGGFIYVTPDLLAQWLQERFLRDQGDLFMQWLPTLPQRLQTAHSRQLERLRGTEQGRRWAARLASPNGPFGDLLALRQPWADSIVLALGAAAKDAAVQYVAGWAQRTPDAPRQIRERSQLRSVLFRLMRTPRGFTSLFDVLVSAISDDGERTHEQVVELLQGMLVATPALSATLAPYEEVVAAVENQLARREASIRRVLIQAVGDGLLSRGGAAYSEFDRDPDEAPRPAAPIATLRRAVELVLRGMDDESSQVRRVAADFLIEGSRVLLNSPPLDEYLAALPRAIAITGSEGTLATELDLFLAHDHPSPEVRSRVQSLRTSLASSVESRMRLVMQGWSTEPTSDDEVMRPTAAQVAQELSELDEHRLLTLMPLVFADSAANPGELMVSLGEQPEAARFWLPLLTAARNAANSWPASLYLATTRDRGCEPTPGALSLLNGTPFDVEVASRAITMSRSSDTDVEALSSFLADAVTDPAWVRACTLARWNEGVSAVAVEALLRGLLANASGAPVAVSLAYRANESRQVISAPLLFRTIGSGIGRVDGHDLWTWHKLADSLARGFPAEVFEVVFAATTERDIGRGDDEVADVLSQCCDHVPSLARRLLELWSLRRYFVSRHLGSIIIEHVPSPQLVEWAGSDAERQSGLGRMVIASDVPLTVTLMEHFGDTGPFASAIESAAGTGTWSGDRSGFYESRGHHWLGFAQRSESRVFARFARRIGERMLAAAESDRAAQAAEDARER